MKLTLLNPHRYPVSRYFANLRLICKLVDQEIGELPGFVNLVFCNDATIHRLNREYRGKDKVTDVLTFTYCGDLQAEQGDSFAPLGMTTRLLGEVVISVPQTKRQAKAYEVTFEQEMYKLCIHGLLHLRGYDHVKDEDYRVMKLLEENVMKSFLTSRKR